MQIRLDRDLVEGRWSRRITAVAISLLACLVLVACRTLIETAIPLGSPEALVEALVHAGAEVRLGERSDQAALGLLPQALFINAEQAWVYWSPEGVNSDAVGGAFEPGQFVWLNEHLIVRYSGHDGGTVLLIDGVLGEPLLRPSVAGEEPYPPAVPAAMRRVAGDLGAEPTGIEVLSYEQVEWPDACLGFRQAGEVCAGEIVPGWRISLRYEQREIEVHTDLLGEAVRWQAP